MVQEQAPNLQQDVISLRLTCLSRSAAFREDVLARLNNDEDPFDMKDYEIDGVQIGIVSQDKDEFAAKLDALIGSGAGDEYLEQVGGITATGAQDTPGNRDHIWHYWKQAADANAALRPKKRGFDETALSRGTQVHFVGDYTGTGPDIVLVEDDSGQPQMRFINAPAIWFKLSA